MAIKVAGTTIIDDARFVVNASKIGIGSTSTNPSDYNSAEPSDVNDKLLVAAGNINCTEVGSGGGYAIGPYVRCSNVSNTSSNVSGDGYPGFATFNYSNVWYSAGEFGFYKAGLDGSLNKTVVATDTDSVGVILARAWSDSNSGRYEHAAGIRFTLNSKNITGSGNNPSADILFTGRNSSNTAQYNEDLVAKINGDNGDFEFISGNGSLAVAYGCRAWVHFVGTATPITISGNGNVSSITDNGTGNYTINFTTALVDTNYATIGGGRRSADVGAAEAAPEVGFSNFATTSVKMACMDNDTNTYNDGSNLTAMIVR